MGQQRVGKAEFVFVPAVHRAEIAADNLRRQEIDNRVMEISDDVTTDQRIPCCCQRATPPAVESRLLQRGIHFFNRCVASGHNDDRRQRSGVCSDDRDPAIERKRGLARVQLDKGIDDTLVSAGLYTRRKWFSAGTPHGGCASLNKHVRRHAIIARCHYKRSRSFRPMRAKIHIGIRVALPILMTGKTSQEATMKRSIVVLIAAVALIGASRASAQEVAPGPGTLEVTVIPGGAQFFTSKNGLPDFGNYTLGGDLAYNFNRIIGVEGAVGTSLGISQDLAFGGLPPNLKTPNILNYTGNVLVSAATGSPVVPYATGGIGGGGGFRTPAVGGPSNEKIFHR